MAPLDQQEREVHLEKLDYLVKMGDKELMEDQDRWDPRDLLVKPVNLDLLDLLEVQDQGGHKEKGDLQVPQAPVVRGVKLDL